MGKTLYSIIPDPKALLSLEPEELAGPVLEVLNSLDEKSDGRPIRYNQSLVTNFQEYPSRFREQISNAVMEAWVWLEGEGLIAPQPGTRGECVFVTRRGKQIQSAFDLESYRKANLLPKGQLHPKIAQKVWATFLRGDWDTAVFQAFKEVEVAVRKAGKFSAEDHGVPLVRKAFDPTNGPLSNKDQPKSWREALLHLFVGAIGSHKNPKSHRNAEIDAEEAVEMIVLASYLLKIVDARSKKR